MLEEERVYYPIQCEIASGHWQEDSKVATSQVTTYTTDLDSNCQGATTS